MWAVLARFRGWLLVGALLLMPLVLLYAQTRNPAARGPVVGVIVDGASLVERTLLVATGAISDGLSHYMASVTSWEELAEYRRHAMNNAVMRAQVKELEAENDQLRQLAFAASRIDGPRPIAARVVGRSGAPLTKIARIDRGRTDGVHRGDGVIASGSAIIGRVLVAGRHASDVLLLTDPTSAVDVVVQRTRARGLLRGAGSEDVYRTRVEDFDRLSDVVPGDVLVTSGLDERLPAGLFVGQVAQVEKRVDGMYLRAEVLPAAPLASFEFVEVLISRRASRLPALADESEGNPKGEAGPRPVALKPASKAAPVIVKPARVAAKAAPKAAPVVVKPAPIAWKSTSVVVKPVPNPIPVVAAPVKSAPKKVPTPAPKVAPKAAPVAMKPPPKTAPTAAPAAMKPAPKTAPTAAPVVVKAAPEPPKAGDTGGTP